MPQKKAKARQTKKKSVKHRRVVKKKSSRSSPVKKTHFFVKLLQKLRTFLFGFIFAGCLTLPFYFYYLDLLVKSQFEGKRWSIPARVYARPLELYEGLKISADQFERELKYCRYHAKNSLKQSGSYQRKNNVFAVHTRPFSFGDSIEKSKKIRVEFADNQLLSVKTMQMKTLNQVVRLDPALIGSFYPQLKEDRILVRLSDIPKSLHNTLIAVEDRSFYQHHGVHVSSLLRAFWENLKAGKVVQGGSTLTQQLVKNFFLDSKRRYLRKLNEVFMAIILEWRYSKREILEAYLNEIYLGQDGSRAIHGVGKASQYYFDQNVSDLNLSQSALLVTLIRGASYYDPRRHPERALKRRNRILDGLYQQKKIKKWGWKLAKQSSLGVTKKAKGSSHLFPAYLDLVKRQLRENYKEEDLTSEGLQIFTSLDPIVQYEVEQAIFNGLTTLEKSRWHHREKLQSAAVVTDTVSGDVLALVGGRNYRYAGFNRAIDANRPIGSLIKPIVYLSAVTEPAHYNMVSLLNDEEIILKNEDGSDWRPENYDKEFHGIVPIHTALTHSYNALTVKLGMNVGLDKVIRTIKQFGVQKEINAYPSLLLGAINLSPLEVTQMYQGLANTGFYSQLRTLRKVLNQQNKPIQRFPTTLKEIADPQSIYLINHMLKLVMREGTGRSAYNIIKNDIAIAGKTGTTDGLRDSWFAGFTGNLLATVWVGRDDNKPSGLTGSSGALQLWAEIMKKSQAQSLELIEPENIIHLWIDVPTSKQSYEGCESAAVFPFINKNLPSGEVTCSSSFFMK